MGSSPSVLKWDRSPPTEKDVNAVRHILLFKLPPELIALILDFSGYWPSLVDARDVRFKGGSTGSLVNWCYMVSPSLDIACEKIYEASFRTLSHDQGWGGEREHKGTYCGSYTWFEAAILRPSSHNSTQYTWVDRMDSPIDMQNLPPPNRGATSYEEVTNLADGSTRWHIQRNVCSSSKLRTHNIVWALGDDPDLPGNEDQPTGSGRGKGFLRSLKTGDRIAIFSCALYPGWKNNVYAVKLMLKYCS